MTIGGNDTAAFDDTGITVSRPCYTHTGWIGLIVAFIHSILHMILQLVSC